MKIRVRIIAESIVTVDTDEIELPDQYEEIEAYLKGKPLNEADPKEIGVAMVWSDVDVNDVPLDELPWKVIGVRETE
jgi:hypothetical protein